MGSIDYSQVHELVNQLPKDKLIDAFRFLQELANVKGSGSYQRDFMQLSLEERRRLLAEQAQEMKTQYEQTTEERQSWQGGDFHNGD